MAKRTRYSLIYTMRNGSPLYVKSMSVKNQMVEFTSRANCARHFPYDFDKATVYIDELSTFPVTLEQQFSYALQVVE